MIKWLIKAIFSNKFKILLPLSVVQVVAFGFEKREEFAEHIFFGLEAYWNLFVAWTKRSARYR